MLKNSQLVDDVEHIGREKNKPADGWKGYPARIIASGGKKKNTQQRGQVKFNEIRDIIREEAEGKQKKTKLDKLTLSSDSSEDSISSSSSSISISSKNHHPAVSSPKLLIPAKEASDYSEKTRQQIELQLQKVTKEKENLQKENDELKRNNLILQKDLPALVSTIQRAQLLSRNSFAKHSDTSGEGSPPPRKVFCSSPESSSPSVFLSSADREKKEIFDSEEAILKYLSYEDLDWARFKTQRNGSHMVARLMEKLFSPEEMENCSQTGKNTTKPPLPSDKLDAIRRYVISHFKPAMDFSKVNSKITSYLRDKGNKKPKGRPDSSSTIQDME